MAQMRDRANGDQRVWCLMWVPKGYDAPLELLEGLRQRKVQVREVRDAPGVMAELGKRGQGIGDRGQGGTGTAEKRDKPRSIVPPPGPPRRVNSEDATDLPRRGRWQVLVIVEPGVLRDAGRLIAAVQRYHPDVKLWKYELGSGKGLQPIQKVGVVDDPARKGKPEGVGERRINREETGVHETTPRREAGRREEASAGYVTTRREVPSPGGEDAATLSQGEREEDQPVVLTAEELAMLLGEGDEKYD